MKQRVYPMIGFKQFGNAAVTTGGIELVQEIRQGSRHFSGDNEGKGGRHVWEAALAA